MRPASAGAGSVWKTHWLGSFGGDRMLQRAPTSAEVVRVVWLRSAADVNRFEGCAFETDL
jgi:hypothetical protein